VAIREGSSLKRGGPFYIKKNAPVDKGATVIRADDVPHRGAQCWCNMEPDEGA